MHIKDPKLNATTGSINDDDLDLNFLHLNSPHPSLTLSPDAANPHMPLSDFNENGLSVIEQFQINHNMQVSNDNIELAKDIENLNNLESQVMETNTTFTPCLRNQTSLLKTPTKNNDTEELNAKPCIVFDSATSNTTVPATKSIILKQGPVRIIKIVTPIQKLPVKQNNKIVQISEINPNKIIVLKSNQTVGAAKQIITSAPSSSSLNRADFKQTSPSPVPSLSYDSWLEHVIEILNDSITVQDSLFVKSTFHVPEAMFNHFSKTFTVNNKRRLPNNTAVIKSGKYKDHIKYTWYFNQATTVHRIFASKNVSFY